MTANIHPSAIIDPEAKLHPSVKIGPFCYVEAGVELGKNVVLQNGVSIHGRTKIAENCQLYPGAVIGQPAQILGHEGHADSRIEIGPRTIIREHVTIHPGKEGPTMIGADCFFMVGVHIAHDCVVSDKCVFANQATLGGHVHVEEQVWMGGLSAVLQFCRLGKHSFVAGGAMVGGSLIPYGFLLGNRAHLTGINLVGLRRRGFSRKTIHDLRAAYRLLFAKEGTFSERIQDTKLAYSDSAEVQEILNFIETYQSPALSLPE